jgi:predicted ATP-grasp superfamily ATP-dependent carboligase
MPFGTGTADGSPERDRIAMTHSLQGVRVIVTDAETRPALYAIRALGMAGCRITAVSSQQQKRRVLGFASRFVSERHVLRPAPYSEALLTALEPLAKRHDVLVPVSTLSLLVVAAHAADLETKLRFYIPPLYALQNATDKAVTLRVAQEAGVPVPQTYYGVEPDTIEEWARDTGVTLPLVVKFADDVRPEDWVFWSPADRYRIVRSIAELGHEYRRMHQIRSHPLVQEYVEGDGYGFFTIASPSSEPITSFCHRRLREYPISGGPSTLCESTYDARLVEVGTRLLKAMRWQGVAMVEFKYDRRQHVYKLMEINPRFWGSLPLAIQCGVNFPVYQVQMALGQTPQSNQSYPLGHKMRFFLQDLKAVTAQWRVGHKWEVMSGYVRELLDVSIQDGLFTRDDLKPTATYLLSLLVR